METKPSQEPTYLVVPASSLPSQPWWPQLHSLINISYEIKETQSFPTSWKRLDEDPVKAATALAQELGTNGQMAVVFLPNNEFSVEQPRDQDKEIEGENYAGHIDSSLLHPVACGGVLPFRGENPLTALANRSTNLEAAAEEASKAEDVTTAAVAEHAATKATTIATAISATKTHLPAPAPASATTQTNGEVPSTTTIPSQTFEQWEICCFCVHPTHRGRGHSGAVLSLIEDWVRRAGGLRLAADWVIEETTRFWERNGFVRVEGAEEIVLRKGFRVDSSEEALARDIRIAVGIKVL